MTLMDIASRGQETVQAQSPSQFHDIVSLQRLVLPVSEDEFLACYWEKKPLIVHRNDPGYYGDLFTLQDFDESITRGPSYIKTAEAVSNKQAKHQGKTAAVLERVLASMHGGHTLILDGMHQFDPKLKRLSQRLAQQTGYSFQTNLYLTPPNGKGFSPHWDNHDVFVLQVLGSKHWKVDKDRRVLPEKTANIEEEQREFRGEVEAFTLRQGDMVYIPRGFVHAAECGTENSLHITLGVYPPTWDEILAAAVRLAAAGDDDLRLALPPGYMNGDSSGILKRMQETLRAMADPAFLIQIIERFRDEAVQKGDLDISGQVQSFFQPVELQIDDQAEPRPNLIYTMRKHGETVTLNVGSRTITFPDFFSEALNFALTRPRYAIRDLPGDLEDGERIIFIERLIQEALVIRK
jgi:ribosomal protein L16 Arg81 hydroxylase